MVLRKPLVLIDGNPAQLPAGDTLDASASEVDVILLNNAGGSANPIGTPVYVSAANSFQAARANAGATCEVLGLVRDGSVAAAANGSIQTDGMLTATAGEWDVITGGSGGLVAGSTYFLDGAAAGKLTTVAPTVTGQYVCRVGRAISTTSLEISIYPPIRL